MLVTNKEISKYTNKQRNKQRSKQAAKSNFSKELEWFAKTRESEYSSALPFSNPSKITTSFCLCF